MMTLTEIMQVARESMRANASALDAYTDARESILAVLLGELEDSDVTTETIDQARILAGEFVVDAIACIGGAR